MLQTSVSLLDHQVPLPRRVRVYNFRPAHRPRPRADAAVGPPDRRTARTDPGPAPLAAATVSSPSATLRSLTSCRALASWPSGASSPTSRRRSALRVRSLLSASCLRAGALPRSSLLAISDPVRVGALHPLFLVTLAIDHLVILRQKLWRHCEFQDAFRMYAASMIVQSSQIFLYPAFAVLFDHVSKAARVRLTVSVPFLKFLLKFAVQRLSQGIKDHRCEVAVCGVEVSASLYQSMILRTSPCRLAMALIIALDAVQGVVTVKWFLDKHTKIRVAMLSDGLLIDAARALVVDTTSSLTKRRQLQSPRSKQPQWCGCVVVATPHRTLTDRRTRPRHGLLRRSNPPHRIHGGLGPAPPRTVPVAHRPHAVGEVQLSTLTFSRRSNRLTSLGVCAVHMDLLRAAVRVVAGHARADEASVRDPWDHAARLTLIGCRSSEVGRAATSRPSFSLVQYGPSVTVRRSWALMDDGEWLTLVPLTGVDFSFQFTSS